LFLSSDSLIYVLLNFSESLSISMIAMGDDS